MLRKLIIIEYTMAFIFLTNATSKIFKSKQINLPWGKMVKDLKCCYQIVI